MAAVAVNNFLMFWIGAVLLGGDALNGKVENGHYFLGSHGRFTEVSFDVFTYSQWHTRSVFVTHSLFFAAAWLLSRRPKAEN